MQKFVDCTLNALVEINSTIDFKNIELFAHSSIGAGGDISSGFDLMAESIFVSHLSSFGKIISEENGVIGSGQDVIILDPIDGSDNIASIFPYYGASIALQRLGCTIAAVICNFATKECFVRFSSNFYQTFLHDFTCKNTIKLHSFSKVGIFEKSHENLDFAKNLINEGLKFRSPGAVALSLAYAHYVNYVLFLGTIRNYDVEAGLYLCKDLHCYRADEVLLISKDRDIFETILTFIKESL
ncbi:MAG: inositol monophosphatase family protein [Campylobacterota bacterium]|nr:inositol monophosphatase family protein [Campylobacterota bacterium]